MNIRKTLLWTLTIALVTLGLTLTSCKKKSNEPTAPKMDTKTAEDMTTDAQQTATDMAEDADKAVDETTDSAEKALEETKAAAEKPAADHPGH